MTRTQEIGAVVLAIGVTASIASVGARLPRDFHSPQALRWSKLAAQRLENGRRTSNTRVLFDALGAADHALRIDPTLADARFHRAVALERLGLVGHAAKAYADYLKHDLSSSRGEIALQKMRKLRRPSVENPFALWRSVQQHLRAAALSGNVSAVNAIVRRFPAETRLMAEGFALGRWADAINTNPENAAKELTIAREVARSLVAVSDEHLSAEAVAVVDAAVSASDRERIKLLARGHQLYSSRYSVHWHGPDAQARMEEAASAFREARSPMQWAAEYERATRQSPMPTMEGCKAIPPLVKSTPPSYQGLRAQIYQRQSLCLAMSGDYQEAFVTGRRAIAVFAGLHEYANAVGARLFQAEVVRQVDDRDALWQFRGETLAWAGTKSEWLNWELLSIAYDTVSESSWDVARSAATLIIESGPTESNFRVDARIVRAAAAWNQGDITSAKQDLEQARHMTSPDNRLGKFERQQIDGAELALKSQSDRSTELLERTLAHAIQSRDAAEICDRHLERARAFRKLNKHREAAEEFSRALQVLSQSPVAIAADRLSEGYFGFSTDIHIELIDLLDRRDEAADAFAVSESSRGRRLLDRSGYELYAPLTVDQVRRALPQGTLLVSFVSLRDRLLIFSIDHQSSHVTHVSVGQNELQKRVNAMSSAILQRTDWQNAAATMDELLFGSLRVVDRYDKIVIVPDIVLEHVPFAALINPASRQFLIERLPIIIAPSASVYAKLSRMEEAPRENALIVGDPHFDSAKFPRFPRLPAASSEAKMIGVLYGANPLLDDAAQLVVVLDRIANAGVIHIGAHTLINVDDPMLSSIVMSDGQLHMRDLASRRIRRGSIAVLAGCRTATHAGKSDINSLALAFLAAGSRSSVGSLWAVEDAATRRFSVRLHELLRAGAPVSQAVRRVQLEMLRSSDATLRDVRSWAAFQVYGGG
jgi:CHAT domain-containing protein